MRRKLPMRTLTLLIACSALAALGAGATLPVARYGAGVGNDRGGAGMGFAFDMFCGDGGRIDSMLGELEQRLKPTASQKDAFGSFNTAAKTAAEKIRSACPIERPRNMPERLTLAEQRTEAALEALRIVRPAVDKLYAVLSDEQKAELNGLRRRWR